MNKQRYSDMKRLRSTRTERDMNKTDVWTEIDIYKKITEIDMKRLKWISSDWNISKQRYIDMQKLWQT